MKNEVPNSDYRSSGIYCISNTVDERIYIGSAARFDWRYRSHKSLLGKGKHNSIILQRFYDKYGAETLIFSLVELCEKDALIAREQYYLDTLQPAFNIRKQAERNTGIKRSAEYRAKLSARMKAWHQTEEGRIFRESKWKGKSKGNLGHKHSPEIRAKISANQNKALISGCNNYLSKLNPEQVIEIRNFVPQKLGDMAELAAHYGVDRSTIKRIRAGKRYKI